MFYQVSVGTNPVLSVKDYKSTGMDLQYNDSLQKVEDPLALEIKDASELIYIGLKDEEYVSKLVPKPPEEGLIELVMDLEEKDLKDDTYIESSLALLSYFHKMETF